MTVVLKVAKSAGASVDLMVICSVLTTVDRSENVSDIRMALPLENHLVFESVVLKGLSLAKRWVVVMADALVDHSVDSRVD